MSKNKAEEVKDYEKLIAKASSLENKIECQSRQAKAKAWLKIDERDLLRQTSNREEFLKHSLENYLLSLVASDDHNRDALRFLALWLEHSAEDLANRAVSKHLKKVPSMKFATLMNQLTSRLQDVDNSFQELLFELVFQICIDHPYHGMYQVFTGSFSDTNEKDDAAVSRKKAALKLATRLSNLNETSKIWMAIKSTSKAYCVLASEKNSRYKSGKRLRLDISPAAKSLNSTLKAYPIPSPTMRIPFSASLDYSRIPVILEMRSEFSIASGISAPKIITTLAENGMNFRQLVKGGNDDLRQDAIMEQVFEQVNELLMINRSTQQRNLSIRTYRVLPLSNIAGVIEYVSNTVSLHEYLMPAHERFHPEDIKAEKCRSQIIAVQSKSPEVRIKAFKAIKERFKPVMRYFFTERFYDPDDWFSKRQAYTRSTAAISILGHVLGLGDRHANNILLDENSGEIVHIDLGIAFEMGRILPIPETVPFRLTRDIIDGMGITKTEGVFRRCCEFTLETLQKESYTIMSILDVLRYDPLYSWSVSPFRLAKLLEEQDLSNVNDAGKLSEKRLINEPGEAARALAGIRKKLTMSLSVYATVNDLINQASDERNLALLFAGWAAFA
ncbi:Bgt-3917 [Blumeria graminis f. sp. tritici]|uniref:Serine/threonine-protein kinase TEL1 n=4 Tax=Blumeria graminis TaxID=34373 RepID=A0A061HEC7_BLUGR|nr:Protein kinase [Blumeria graminis f. sp. tritici 96224]VDB94597.1 Bgt-3917 [Blumeria graminis f. sp. tritici]